MLPDAHLPFFHSLVIQAHVQQIPKNKNKENITTLHGTLSAPAPQRLS